MNMSTIKLEKSQKIYKLSENKRKNNGKTKNIKRGWGEILDRD